MTEDTLQLDCRYCNFHHSYWTPDGNLSFCAVNPSLFNNAINCGDYDPVDNINQITKEPNLHELDCLNDYYVPSHNVFNNSGSVLEGIEYKPGERHRQVERITANAYWEEMQLNRINNRDRRELSIKYGCKEELSQEEIEEWHNRYLQSPFVYLFIRQVL